MGGADGTGPEFYLQAVLFHETVATYKCICEVLECNSEFQENPWVTHTHTHTHTHTTAQRQGWRSYFVHHNPAHVDVVKDSDAKKSNKFVTLT